VNLHHGIRAWLSRHHRRSSVAGGDPGWIHVGAIETAGRTDRGRVRRRNEDSFTIARMTRPARGTTPGAPALLLAIADGMGGLAGGDEASAGALRAFVGHLRRHAPAARPDSLDVVDLDRVLLDGFQVAHETVQAMAAARHADMGTTLSAAYITRTQTYVCHVGDSRCYWVHDGVARRLTHDHTLAQQLAARDPAHAPLAGSPWSHVLTNAVGTRAGPPTVEQHVVKAHPGDLLLLCSDGVTRYLSDRQIAAIAGLRGAGEICDVLIDTANAGGGADNLTVVVARF